VLETATISDVYEARRGRKQKVRVNTRLVGKDGRDHALELSSATQCVSVGLS